MAIVHSERALDRELVRDLSDDACLLAAIARLMLDSEGLSSPEGDAELAVACTRAFLRRQLRLAEALGALARGGHFHAELAIARTMHEYSVRYTWLVKNPRTRRDRVLRWYATVWVDEYRAKRHSGYVSDEQRRRLRQNALGSVGEYMSPEDATALEETIDQTRKLRKRFDPYGSVQFAQMQCEVFGDSAEAYRADYAELSAAVHAMPSAMDGASVERGDGVYHVEDDPDVPVVGVMGLREGIKWLAMMLDEASRAHELSFGAVLQAFVSRQAETWGVDRAGRREGV